MAAVKRFLKWAGILLGVVVLVIGAAAAYVGATPIPSYPVEKIDLKVDVTPERVARGKRTAEMLCAACHLDPAAGALTGRRVADVPPQFGESYSLNITRHPVEGIGSWTDGELAYLLRTGVARDGRYTPPWMVKMPLLSDEDLKDVIAFLRSDDPLVEARDAKDRPSHPSFLTKALCRVAFKPFPYPKSPIVAPPETDKIVFGRYLATGRLQCFGCHSADFKTVDEMHPEKSAGYFGGGNAMPDLTGEIVPTSNLTPDPETGIGKWTEPQFRRALIDGIGPDNRPVRYPMVPYRNVTDDEAAALFAYLKTVPAIRNAIPAPKETAIVAADRGQQIYHFYGCNRCHGETGLGTWDLRKGPAHYPTDEALIAYIKHPEVAKPGIAMPTWDGVIQEDEYPALVTHVRTLAR
jgi:mono/diheme cytochrome c family protein